MELEDEYAHQSPSNRVPKRWYAVPGVAKGDFEVFPQRVGGGPTPNQDVPVPRPQIGRDPGQKRNYRDTANGENNKRLFESPLNKKEPDCCSADRQQQHTVIE